MNISASLEDYLNAIYKLDIKNEGARLTDIAQYLNVKKSSANSALNTLKNEELVNYEKYKNITLTGKGISVAKHIDKRNTLFKKFLTDILDVTDELATKEAEDLAHCISCHTTAKLEKFIEDIFNYSNEEYIIKRKGRESV